MKDESDVDGESPLRKTSQPNEREGHDVAGPELPARRKFIQASLLAGASAAVLIPRPSLGESSQHFAGVSNKELGWIVRT